MYSSFGRVNINSFVIVASWETITKNTWSQREVNGLTMAGLRMDGDKDGKEHSGNGKLMQVSYRRAVWTMAAVLNLCGV